MHGLLCDKDSMDKVGVNTNFTAVRSKTLSARRRPPRAHTRTIDDTKNHAHWRSAYLHRFAALLHRLHRSTCLGERSENWKEMKGAFWTNVIRNSCLEWVLSEETRVQAQVTRMWSHHISTMVTERGFTWILDRTRSNANEKLSTLSLWETATRVLDEHEYPEVKVDQLGDELPGKGRPTWTCQNGRIFDAHRAWRNMLVSASDIHDLQDGGPRRVVHLHGRVWIRFVPLVHCRSRSCHCIRLHDKVTFLS